MFGNGLFVQLIYTATTTYWFVLLLLLLSVLGLVFVVVGAGGAGEESRYSTAMLTLPFDLLNACMFAASSKKPISFNC